MNIRTKLVASFLIISLIGGVIGYVGYSGSNQIFNDFDIMIDDTTPEIMLLGEIDSLSLKLQSEAVSHVLIQSQSEGSAHDEELEEFEKTNSELDAAILHLQILAESHDDMEESAFVSQIVNLKTDLYSASLNLIEASDFQSILLLKEELEDAEDKIDDALQTRMTQVKQDLERLDLVTAKTASEITTMVLVTGILGVVFAIVLGAIASRNIVRPIMALNAGVSKMEKGDYNIQLETIGDDEISELSRVFNTMASTLNRNIELQKELVLSRENMKKEKLETIGLMSSSLSHNLRNPLAAIKGMADMLKLTLKDKLDESDKHRFSIIDKSILNMVDQIEGVLAFVQNKPLSIESHSVLKILESTNDKLIVPSGVEIHLPDIDVEINCDSQKLEVVFSNIILNAIQSIEEKGSIKIRIKSVNEQVIVEIEYSGQGIDEKLLSKIFDPLFTTKSFGTGLGLAACKGIIEQHGGTISVKNNPTTFMISLPRNLTSEQVIDKNKSMV